VPVEDAFFLHIEVEEPFVLFEPLAEVDFPEAGIPEIRRCML